MQAESILVRPELAEAWRQASAAQRRRAEDAMARILAMPEDEVQVREETRHRLADEAGQHWQGGDGLVYQQGLRAEWEAS